MDINTCIWHRLSVTSTFLWFSSKRRGKEKRIKVQKNLQCYRQKQINYTSEECNSILWAIQITVLIDTLLLKTSLLHLKSQPSQNYLGKPPSVNRVVHSWLLSFLLKQVMLTHSRYSMSHKNVLHLPTPMLFVLSFSYLGHINSIRLSLFLFYCYPSWMHLLMLCLNVFSFGNSSLIHPEEITLIYSDGILWISVFIHHIILFIMPMHYTFFNRLLNS